MQPTIASKGLRGVRDLLRPIHTSKAIRFVLAAAPRWTALSLVLIAIQGLVPFGTLYVLKLLVDRLTGPTTLDTFSNTFPELLFLIALALAATVLGLLCSAFLAHANTVQGQLVADHMQRIVQSKSIELDLEYYENSQFFDNLHRAQREAPTRPIRIVDSLTQVVRNSFTLFAALIVLMTFHFGVVLVLFASSLPVIYFRLAHTHRFFDLQVKTTTLERKRKYLNQLLTSAESAKEVRVFDFGPQLIRWYDDYTRLLRTGNNKLSADGARRQFITEVFAATAAYSSLALIVSSAANGAISIGQLLLYFGSFQIAMNALRPLLSSLAAFYENNLFLTTLFDFLNVRRTIAEPIAPTPPPRQWRSGIVMENVCFRYPGTNEFILDRISLSIRPGEIVALVGQNGTGKTTLTKLLCRLYDPTSGRISLDGVDLKEYGTKELRGHFSVIYQDFGRYHLTARENIRIGSSSLNPDADTIKDAAKWAGIHDEICRLPNGYDTVMSRSLADGEELSLGQWQKLALARAFVRESQFIILDEPTSSLDAAAEFEFFEKFREMAKGRSALIISHRFSTVRLADRVYVLDKGRITEEGTHESLMTQGGLYAELYKKQASYYAS